MQTKKARVVIIEDLDSVRRTWVNSFQKTGRCSQILAPTEGFQTAVEAALKDPGDYFDIFVLDLHLGRSASDGGDIWKSLIKKFKGQAHLGKLVVCSQRVEGEPVEDLLANYDAVQCTSVNQSYVESFVSHVLNMVGA